MLIIGSSRDIFDGVMFFLCHALSFCGYLDKQEPKPSQLYSLLDDVIGLGLQLTHEQPGVLLLLRDVLFAGEFLARFSASRRERRLVSDFYMHLYSALHRSQLQPTVHPYVCHSEMLTPEKVDVP